MKKLRLIKAYLKYLLKAKTKYVIHSPFVFELLTKVLHDKTRYEDYALLEEVKRTQSERKDPIETVDFGSSAGKAGYRTLIIRRGKIVKQRSSGKPQLELLYRLSRFLNPETILEFGTAAGISAAYMKKAAPAAKLITLEGCANLADFAEDTFAKLNLKNIEVVSGNFDVSLKDVLNSEKKLDLVFFDGNHRKEPTISYFNSCLKLAHENSVFVFDDIHWSPEMEEAWAAIRASEEVSITIDLFWMGLVFFKKGIVKQDFIIK
ncbi:MAG: class I SAM-dependent methyltransferase [Bacteroidales bacterium]|nr:class I SAM-dependent methyltransferase [Bacteroidales bacterium]MCF6342443.1 class I SAM-dependent methyltransferase [Bacteroidales bacterium]